MMIFNASTRCLGTNARTNNCRFIKNYSKKEKNTRRRGRRGRRCTNLSDHLIVITSHDSNNNSNNDIINSSRRRKPTQFEGRILLSSSSSSSINVSKEEFEEEGDNIKFEKKLYALSLTACMQMLAFGAACGCIAGAIVYIDFGNQIILTSTIKGAIVAALPLGAAFACLIVGSKYASERFGRKDIFRVANALYVLSALMAAISSSFETLILARFIGGFASGISTAITTVFISECVPAETRGKFTSLSPLFGTIGLLYAFVSSLIISSLFGLGGGGEVVVAVGGSGFTNSNLHSSLIWRLMLLVPILPCAVQELIFRLKPDVCPESPRWLASRGRSLEARKIMENLGQKLPWNTNEVVGSLATVDVRPMEDSGFVGLFKTAKHIKATSIACGLNMLQQFCGINVIVYYAPKILNSLGYGKRESILLTVMVATCQICFGTYLSKKIDVFGRKTMAMFGICGIIFGCALIAFSFTSSAALNAINQLTGANSGILAIIGILIFRVSFSLSLGPIPYVVSSEVFPKDARSSGVALATLVQWLCNVLVTFTFLNFVDLFGASNVFIAYTFVGVFALASVYYLLPETNQTKLEDN